MAEYRVYQYFIKTKKPQLKVVDTVTTEDTKPSQLVSSTLDPFSFLAFHGGHSALSIDTVRTWLCPGYTGGARPICPSPYEKILNQRFNKDE
jgi:hypothetical protein